MADPTGLPEPTTGSKCVGDPAIGCPNRKKATVHLLVGGPYERNGKNHPYGHVALRVVTDTQDFTYDYGRYGATWGLGGSEGEGMLRVWTDHGKYIAGENSTGRVTTTFSYETTEADAQKVIAHFNGKIASKKPNIDRGYMKQYRIEDYHALSTNCTTVSVDGATIALPSLMDGSKKFNVGNGLSGSEKFAAKLNGWPDRIFMPADLGNFLRTKKIDAVIK